MNFTKKTLQNYSKAAETASATCTSLFRSSQSSKEDLNEFYGFRTDEEYKQQYEKKLYNDQIKTLKPTQSSINSSRCKYDPSSTKQLFLDYKALDSKQDGEQQSSTLSNENPLTTKNNFMRYKSRLTSFRSSIKFGSAKNNSEDKMPSEFDQMNLSRIEIPSLSELCNFKYTSSSVVDSPDMIIFQNDYSYSDKKWQMPPKTTHLIN